MAAALVLLLVAQGDLEPLRQPSRAAREAAIVRLAADGPPSADLVGRLVSGDTRIAAGVAAILRRRLDPEVLPQLARVADRPDAEPAAAAASILVATAGARRIPLVTLHFEGQALLPARLRAAVADAVRAHLAGRRERARVDRPHLDRPLYAMAGYAEPVLRAALGDRLASEESRADALFALAWLAGRASRPDLLAALDDPSPRVRRGAATLLLRYGDRVALARLAQLLGSERTLQAPVRRSASIAARRVRVLDERGVERLRFVVEQGNLWEAVDAVRALRATHPALAQQLVNRRARYLAREGSPRAHAYRAAWLELGAGPLAEELRARLRAGPCAVAAAAFVADDPLARLRPELSVDGPGSDEPLRLHLIYTLLRKHDAPPADRLAFARLALDAGSVTTRRLALRILEGVDPERWADLRARVTASLGHGAESVRLAAAALLLPDSGAFGVCVDALYDGDPIAARTVARLLKRARPDLAPIDPAWPVARRRQAALELARSRE